MKVKCIANRGEDLSLQSIEAGDLITTDFQIDIGNIYIVYGIAIWKGVIQYLTFDKHETLPFWHPSELFIVVDNALPNEWYFQYYGDKNEHNLMALWGYKELVSDQSHYEELIEREDKAIKVFLQRKEEIE